MKVKDSLTAIDEQRFADAINGLDAISNQIPEESEHLICYYKAHACFAACQRAFLDSSLSYEARANTIKASPRYAKGVALLLQSIEQKPRFFPAYDELLSFYDLVDDGESALPVADRFIELMPDSHVAYRWRSKSHNHLDDFSSALDDINEAISLHPRAFENHFERGRILSAKAEFNASADAYLAASKLGDNNESIGVYCAALSLKQGGRYEKAIELFRRLDSSVFPAEHMISECSRLLVPSR